MAHRIFEEDAELILNHIKTNIVSALSQVRADAGDALVATDPPVSFFFYNPIKAYRCPAIIIDVADMSTRLVETQANHINAEFRVNVYCVIQDKTVEILTRRAWRYMRALSTILYGITLTSSDLKVKIVIKPERYALGDEVTTSQDSSVPPGVFQKGCLIELAVEHYEAI